MIPEVAVEAAAKLIYRTSGRRRVMSYEHARAACEEDAISILEAAAPHLMAEAFDQGQKSGARHADRLIAAAKIGRPDLPGPITPNPYRPTP